MLATSSFQRAGKAFSSLRVLHAHSPGTALLIFCVYVGMCVKMCDRGFAFAANGLFVRYISPCTILKQHLVFKARVTCSWCVRTGVVTRFAICFAEEEGSCVCRLDSSVVYSR